MAVLAILVLLGLMVLVALVGAVLVAVLADGRLHPAHPDVPTWHHAQRRMQTLSVAAAVAGVGAALVALLVLPTTFVSATRSPGLLAALGPVVAGLVFVLVLAAGELTWPRPEGREREAFLVRRPALAPARTLSASLVPVWLALGAVVVVVFGVTGAADGRSVRRTSVDAGGLVVGQGAGPYPGWPYGLPVLAGMVVLVLAGTWVRHLMTRRPAVAGVTPDQDLRVRTTSAARVATGVQLALSATLVGLLFFGGSALGRVDLPAGQAASWAAAVGIAALSLLAAARTVRT